LIKLLASQVTSSSSYSSSSLFCNSLPQAGAWYISTMPSLDNKVRNGLGCNGLVKKSTACSALESGSLSLLTILTLQSN